MAAETIQKLVCWLAPLLLLGAPSLMAQSSATADRIFSDMQGSVFQIRMIEQKSGSQIALGTGFLIAADRIATNYHVISLEVLEPERFRIELELDGEVVPLKVVTVDVVNDLALLSADTLTLAGPFFELAKDVPKQGAVVYSLGNPHNLGMTIVAGNYNGLVEHKYLDRIHYSGAINAGMSGGPAVNQASQVVGINVASAGNQVGFLVPVKALISLAEKGQALPEQYDLLQDMAQQIGVATDGMLAEVLAAEWPVEAMGAAKILGKTVSWFDCWGNSDDDKESHSLEISRGCNNADNIFLSHEFNTGYFEYEYYYFEALDWPKSAFYRYLRNSTASARPGNKATKDDVGNYHCEDVDLRTENRVAAVDDLAGSVSSMKRRVSYCVRPYKKLKGLYDVFFIGVSEDRDHQAVMDHFTLAGVTQAASKKFLQRFVQVVAWQ